ncbi:MAG TPA: exopolysaccharide biosynthesis polyprenyl glycosylphosphotransferase, partial [Candidatus Babeliaceae bacterium]|nr:exopolysaccharide biosynthesis polyprenyl glycosylphosphotransferase [Candidatus Babeliaceae bacterium]
MNRQFERYLQITLVALDLLVLNALYFTSHIFLQHPALSGNAYIIYWAFVNIAWFILSFFLRTYAEKVILNFEYFTKRTIQVYLVWIIALLVYLFFSNEFRISHKFIVFNVIAFGAGLLINRFLYLGIKNYFKRKDYLIKKVIILGYNDTAKKLAKYFEEDGINTKVIGFIEDNQNIHELSHYPVLSSVDNALNIARELGAQEIFSTITPEENKNIYSLMYEAEKEFIRFKIVPNLSVFVAREVHIDYFGDLPILSLRSDPLEDVGNRIKKRALDLAVSFLVIALLLSWLIPILGLLILLESRGPVFFKQMRTGRNNKPFSCLKFRSMRTNKDADLKQATQNDSRITGIGRIIRKTSIDELPQFINVFLGEMSIVGPRPHMLKHTNDYSQVVDDFMIRQFIKPGITGWAQINGYRGEINNPE